MAVYVIRGSEDGIICVKGSYRKAYDACVEYIYHGIDDTDCITFREFKKDLIKYRVATVHAHGDDQAECEAYRMEVE